MPEWGQELGFGGLIVHGVYAYNCIAHDLLKELGQSNPENLREFQAKFAGPVRPEDEIQTQVWRTAPDTDGWEEVRWIAKVVNTGKVCLSDGKAVIRTAISSVISKL